MQYVRLNLVQPYQRRPVTGRADETVAVQMARGGAEQGPLKKIAIKYEKILSFSPPTGISRKRVLIEGVPGSGKSTLVQRMCHDWSIGDFAQDFKVVVQVTLRNLPKDKKLSLEDLIYTSIASQKAVSEISDFISDHDGQHVLFIFDGFDEVSEQMRKRSIVRDVLAGRLAPLSSFIITTRPISAESLYSCVDRRIEITGFGDQEIHTFVTGYFSSFNPAAGKKLLSALSTRPSIKRLCYVPLLLLLICYSVSLGGEAAELPRTLHNLFENLIYLTINHNLERAEREERIGNLQDLSRLCRGFDELTSLALEGIERDTMVFSDLNFEVDDALHGLFNCIESRNHLGVISRTWHFLHLTLQEFMAALAVAKMTPEDQFSFWKERLLLKFDKKGMFIVAADRYLTMFTLFCGITGLQNRGIQNLLLDVVGDLWKPEIRYGTPLEKICRVIAESGNQALAIRLLSPFRRIVVQVNARLDLPSVTWCIMASKESVEELIAIDSFDRFGAMDSFDYFGVPLSTLAHFLGQLDQLSCLSAMEMPRIVCERSSSSSDKGKGGLSVCLKLIVPSCMCAFCDLWHEANQGALHIKHCDSHTKCHILCKPLQPTLNNIKCWSFQVHFGIQQAHWLPSISQLHHLQADWLILFKLAVQSHILYKALFCHLVKHMIYVQYNCALQCINSLFRPWLLICVCMHECVICSMHGPQLAGK